MAERVDLHAHHVSGLLERGRVHAGADPDGVPIFDMRPQQEEAVRSGRFRRYFYDGLHLSKEGYRKLQASLEEAGLFPDSAPARSG